MKLSIVHVMLKHHDPADSMKDELGSRWNRNTI